MVKTLFLDLDDTLINHTKAQNKSLTILRSKYFPDVTQNEFNKIWSEQTKIFWKLFTDKTLSFVDQRSQRTKAIWNYFGREIDLSTAEMIANEYVRLYEENWRLFKGLRKCLKFLKRKGIKMGIISNGNYSQQIKKINHAEATDFFQPGLIIVSESIGVSKPDLGVFKYAQRLAKKKNNDLVYFGNSMEEDIEPAKRLGWQAILVNLPKDIADFIKKNF